MAEQSGFFDAHLINGEYDRVYLAEHFAKYFASFIGNGIFGGKSNELQVREKETASMGVRVLSGQAWIDGYWYENDDEYPLSIDVADGVLHRIDSIVVRWNHSERIIRLAVKKGVAATAPVAPIVQRDNDYYELKLADIYIKAGTTKITQANITDKRLNTNECGLVVGVVQQLDADEFGIQLETYISEFITEHNAWEKQFKSDSNNAVNTLISNKEAEFDKVIDELNQIADDVDLVQVNRNIGILQQNIYNINDSISALERLALYDSNHPGCYFREVNGITEWINPPNIPGIEYCTTERWNDNPVYQKTFYIATLPNNNIVGIEVEAGWNKIISIDGFAQSDDDMYFYPFPIITNGLTSAAAIIRVEDNGDNTGVIAIRTNEDLSYLKAYITIKYVK